MPTLILDIIAVIGWFYALAGLLALGDAAYRILYKVVNDLFGWHPL